MSRSVQYLVRSFPSGPSTTENTEASGEEDLVAIDIYCRSGGKGQSDRIGESDQ